MISLFFCLVVNRLAAMATWSCLLSGEISDNQGIDWSTTRNRLVTTGETVGSLERQHSDGAGWQPR